MKFVKKVLGELVMVGFEMGVFRGGWYEGDGV